MLLNSVVIVLREVLEAALILSVLLAASRFLGVALRWSWPALAVGLVAALILASGMDAVSEWFDGVGQELVNASLQIAASLFLTGCVYLIARSGTAGEAPALLPRLMQAVVAMAVAREGAEIFVFVTGFAGTGDFLGSVGVGSLIGAAVGFSIGALFYYFLLAQPRGRALTLATVLLILSGAGMCAQGARQLIQADVLYSAGPLWDTSGWLPENSLVGQLLYALVGYEATPSASEAAIHVLTLTAMILAAWLGSVRRPAQAVAA